LVELADVVGVAADGGGSSVKPPLYSHISDQYAPFHTKVISSPVRDATHVL
jgi:hypothetical protein